jgi:hypothetical protein
MIKPLLKISNDLDIISKRKSKYNSDPGFVKHGIYIRENRNTFEKLFILRGNLMRKYKYSKIVTKFKSPLVNDYNLHLVGGWAWPEVIGQECIYRVLEGNKPMGFYCSFNKKERDKLVELIRNDGNWSYTISERIVDKEHTMYEVGASTIGFFEDVFDMESLLADYIAYGKAINVPNDYIDFVVGHLEELSSDRVEDYLYWDYANPEGPAELITAGLTLGYPIESTVSILLFE